MKSFLKKVLLENVLLKKIFLENIFASYKEIQCFRKFVILLSPFLYLILRIFKTSVCMKHLHICTNLQDKQTLKRLNLGSGNYKLIRKTIDTE